MFADLVVQKLFSPLTNRIFQKLIRISYDYHQTKTKCIYLASTIIFIS